MKIFYLFIFNLTLMIGGFSNVKCSDEKILICGVIKNGAKGFSTVKHYAEEVGSKFLDYRVIVYENNSTDNTKELYSSWAEENPKVIFISEDLTQEFIDNFTPKKGDYRTEFIARARNIVLDRAFHVEFDDFKYHIMVDLDSFQSWPTEAIINTIEQPKKEWDAVCANGSYDLYALRGEGFKINYNVLKDSWFEALPAIGYKLKKSLQKGHWLRVESAFGGLVIYKRNSINECRYSGLLNSLYLDKLIRDDYSRDFLFLKFKRNQLTKKIEKNLVEYIQWEKDLISNNKLPSNPYTCEHVQFHYQMISKGCEKIYINPELKMFSQEHPNY